MTKHHGRIHRTEIFTDSNMVDRVGSKYKLNTLQDFFRTLRVWICVPIYKPSSKIVRLKFSLVMHPSLLDGFLAELEEKVQ